MPEMRTTTLIINAPIDPQPLDAQFKLVRYDVPERFRFLSRNNKTAFARLHIQVRSQIWQPYQFYTHDQMGPSDHALYVLYAGDDPERTIDLPLLNVDALPQRTISFSDLPHHMIIKLLQAQYFGAAESVRFTSQGKHFLLARVGDRRFIGLEIELKGAKTNNEHEGSQIYRIIGHATRFIRVSPEELSNQQLYTYEYVQRLEPRGGQYLLSVVPPDKVRDCPNPLYRIYRESGSRPTLDYHAQRNYKQTRGYLLFTYISAFVDYLAEYGIDVTQAYRDFTEHRIDERRAQLRPPDSMTICLLDQRFNQQGVPLVAYQQLLSQTFPGYSFEPIAGLSLAKERPTLILQDTTAEAFEDGSILAGETDPYQQLYRNTETLNSPKQSICINPNDAETAASREAYLYYPLCDFNTPSGFPLRFQVCLNQLMLKDLVLNDIPVASYLPFMEVAATADAVSLQSYIFVRRQTFKGISYTVLLYFENGHAKFLDLNVPDEKERRDALLTGLGLNWTRDVIDPWRTKYRMEKPENESRTPYHFILGSGQIIEVEDCEERVLYEYDAIGARQEAIDAPVPITDLKLAPHYDLLRKQPMVPLAKLSKVAQSRASTAKLSKQIRESIEFYDQLTRFDAFLDEVAVHHRRISFNALTSGENGGHLDAIFYSDKISERAALPKPDEPAWVRGRLRKLYQRRGMFLSDKGRDVQRYQGIWVDPEWRFMVGSPDQLKFEQARAHLIRRFDHYQGSERFPVDLFLNTLSVQFVRLEQYTVYPYPFHLIDLYVETKLHWAGYDVTPAEVG